MNPRNRHPFFILLLVLLFARWTVADVIEQVVAQVNNDIIPYSQLKREQDGLMNTLRTKYSGKDLEQEYTKACKVILPALIDELLMTQKAKEYGMAKDLDPEVNNYIDNLMKQYNIPNLEALKEAMVEQGTTYDEYTENVRRQILSERFKWGLCRQKVKVMSTDIDKYYEAHANEFQIPEKVDLEEIVFYTKEKDPVSVRAKADEAMRLLKEGKSFSDVAKSHSDGPSAAQGGAIGSFPFSSLSNKTQSVVKTLKESGFSDLVSTDFGFQIIHLVRREAAKPLPLNDVRQEIENRLFLTQAEPIMKDYMKELRSESYIMITPEFKSLYDVESEISRKKTAGADGVVIKAPTTGHDASTKNKKSDGKKKADKKN